jgi:hypothetical protein
VSPKPDFCEFCFQSKTVSYSLRLDGWSCLTCHLTQKENMPQWTNAKETNFTVVPKGDYIFTVVDVKYQYSKGQKTSGEPQWELKLELEPTGSQIFETLTISERSEPCMFKVESFLKCCGLEKQCSKGWSAIKQEAEQNGWFWVQLMGLRGWAYIDQETYKGKLKNKVDHYYADKPKLPPRAQPEQEDGF